MKIIFLNIYNGVEERGSEIFVSELACRLVSKHEVTVVQSGLKGKFPYRQKVIMGIPYLSNSGFRNVFYHFLVLYFTLRALPFIIKEGCDWLIPVNGRSQVLICRLVRKIKKCRILIGGHAGIGREDGINLIIGRPDIFVALTPSALTWAKHIAPRTKVQLIPNAVDLKKFHLKTENKTQFKRPLVLSVSAILPYKRIDLLIKAIAKLPGVNFLLIGDGPARTEITKLGASLLPERFFYIPHVKHNKMPIYYGAADIFSLPSKSSEAFGLVYLEAMASNLPVVAPSDDNRKFIIGKAGLLCNVSDLDDYAGTLTAALKTDFRDLPRQQAEKFSWDNIASQYEQIIETVS